MKSSELHVGGMALCLALGFVVNAIAQEAPQPTPEHGILKKDVGQWEAEMKVWPQPGADPIVAKCQETNSMLGGLWLLSDFSGELLGQEFKGHGQFGYDEDKKQYVATWIDSMSKHMSSMTGKYDKEKDSMTMEGETIDPATNQAIMTRNVTRYKGADQRVMEMFMKVGDEWVKSMEISYTRKK